MNNFDSLLRIVTGEAKRAGLPVSDRTEPHVVVNKRAKCRFGLCRKTADGFRIELSDRLLDAPEVSVRQTLAHELIHTCPGAFDHGELFRSYAVRMNELYGYNISRTSSAGDMGVSDREDSARFIIRCTKCGALIYRMRMCGLISNMDQCRCGRCGGSLELIKGSLDPLKPREAKYILACRKCGMQYARNRYCRSVQHPSEFRCSSCGGRLIRTK